MISAKVLFKTAEKFTADNAPVLLTGVAIVGAVGTAVLAARGGYEAFGKIEEESERRHIMTPTGQPYLFTKKEKALLVWREYLPAAGVCTVTVASVFLANRINTKRAAAMAAAFSISEKAYSEYKEKVADKFTPAKERQVRDEIAQDHVTANPPKDSQIIITGAGDVLCHDLATGRYFRSNVEKIRSIQNTVNQQVNELGQAALSDLYVALGLSPTPYSEELGWTTNKLLDIHFSAVITDENQPCIVIEYTYESLRSGFPRGCDTDPNF